MMQPISRARNYWTAEEDQILKEEAILQGEPCFILLAMSCKANHRKNFPLVNTTGNVKNWSIIATKLKSRTNKDCRKRWSKLQTNVNKGIWSSEEDHRLRKAVEKRGLSYDGTLWVIVVYIEYC
jgi:myb-related protein